MLFNSYIFICILLPVALLGWYGLNYFGLNRAASIFLTGISLWFYGYFNVFYLLIIICSIAFNYVVSLIADRAREEGLGRLLMVIAVFVNLGILFYFKYFDFFLQNLNAVTGAGVPLKGILLPLGISFFTFQQLSYVIDRCLGRVEHAGLIEYAQFVTFFPQLIAGPIVLHDELIPQFRDLSLRRFDIEFFARGVRLFVLGLAKKMLLADVLAGPVNYAFAISHDLDSLTIVFVMLMYAFELYFDFSGYCDMAMGIGLMFNIVLPMNFDSPYQSSTVKELWNRWHMTLSRFFITYVYVPLGGSRRGYARTLLNILIVFTLSGLWHGANWTYVLWGLINGLFVIWDNLCIVGVEGTDYKRECRVYIPRRVGQVLTFCSFLLTLVFFRSSSVPEAFRLIGTAFSFKWNGRLTDVLSHLSSPEFYVVEEAARMASEKLVPWVHVVMSALMIALSFVLVMGPSVTVRAVRETERPVRRAILLGVLFVWCFTSLSQVSTFLYFNF